ncbi:MAG: hypothetical protein Fur0022_31040 [Anaerolineales bacterium]
MFTFRRLTVCMFLILMVSLAGCMGANEEFIQGEWQFEEPHLRNLPAEPHLTVVWTFNGGYFYNYSCCFNQNVELSGNYRIMSDEGNVLILELYNFAGSEAFKGPSELRVEIDQATDTLKIYGAGPFTRMTPKYGDEG